MTNHLNTIVLVFSDFVYPEPSPGNISPHLRVKVMFFSAPPPSSSPPHPGEYKPLNPELFRGRPSTAPKTCQNLCRHTFLDNTFDTNHLKYNHYGIWGISFIMRLGLATFSWTSCSSSDLQFNVCLPSPGSRSWRFSRLCGLPKQTDT